MNSPSGLDPTTTGTATAAASGLAALTRIAPLALGGGRRAGRLIERNVMVYRRHWILLVSGLFEPFFYLLSIGVGLATLVGPSTSTAWSCRTRCSWRPACWPPRP